MNDDRLELKSIEPPTVPWCKVWGAFFALSGMAYLGLWVLGRVNIVGLGLGVVACAAAIYYLRTAQPPKRAQGALRIKPAPEPIRERVEPTIPFGETVRSRVGNEPSLR